VEIEEINKTDETPLEYQVFALSFREPGAIAAFAESLDPHNVGVIHGDHGVGEFYSAILDFYQETKIDPVNPIAFKAWLQTETDIYDVLGGAGGVDFFVDTLQHIELSNVDSVIKVLKWKANRRHQMNHMQSLQSILAQKGHKSDADIEKIRELTDKIQALETDLDANPLDKVETAADIIKNAGELMTIPPFLPTPFLSYNRALGYCVDPETEILTQDGWLTYGELVAGKTMIMAYNADTDSLKWEPLRDIYINDDYVGPITELSNTRFSALVTPHHKWAFKPRRSSNVAIKRTYELPGEGELLTHAKFSLENSETLSDDLVQFCAWYYTEGSYYNDEYISTCQSEAYNKDNVQEIRRLLEALGGIRAEYSKPACFTCINEASYGSLCSKHYHQWYRKNKDHNIEVPGSKMQHLDLVYKESSHKAKDMVYWLLGGEPVKEITSYISGKEKIPSKEFISKLSQRQADIFIKAAHRGDGTKGTNQFHQHSTERMDAFCSIAVIAGYRVSLDSLGTTASFNRTHVALNKVKRVTYNYEGTIWCPMTHSGFWVARRKGKVFITGNTDDGGYFRGALHAVVAQSGKGKSTFTKNLANFWLDAGYRVLTINFEEAKNHWERILMTQIIKENVYEKADTWTDQEKEDKLNIFKEKLTEWGDRLMVRHDPESIFFEDIEIWLRDIIGHNENMPDVVIIDTIQSMITKRSGGPRWSEYESMMIRLEKLAKEMNAVFVITAQQNNEASKEKREMLEQRDVGGSVVIVQKCSIITVIAPRRGVTDDEAGDDIVMDLQIIKNRITGGSFTLDPPSVIYRDESKSYEEFEIVDRGEYDMAQEIAEDIFGLEDFLA